MLHRVLKTVLIGLYGLIPLVPLILLVVQPLPESHAGRPFRDNLASALAMTGFAVVFLEYLVICRIRPIANLFGCDRVMRVHQLFARTACVFLLVHPFVYSLWGKISPSGSPTPNALGVGGGSLLTGALAWASLMALVVLAIHRHDPSNAYDRWRFWHAVLAFVVIAFGLHHTLHAGLYASLPWFAAYWWALFIMALLVNFAIYLFIPWRQSAHAYQVAAVRPQAQGIWALDLLAVGRPVPSPDPGQFFWIKHRTPWSRRDHPFSVAGHSADGHQISFLIKEAGDFTQSVPRLALGERFYLDGPYGAFQIPDSAQTVVLVAGGIGIAPVLHLLSQSARRNDTRRMLVIVAARDPESHVAMQAWVPLADLPNVTVLRVVEQPNGPWAERVGRCDGAFVVALCKEHGVALNASGVRALICGPTAMADSVESGLVEAGLPISALTTERYQYDLGKHSPVAARSVGLWWMASGAMLTAVVVLASAM